MSVNTHHDPTTGQPAPDLPPELRSDGAGNRSIDVLIAIKTAHDARAFASSVTTVDHPAHRTLRVHLQATQACDGYASADQADTVLRAFSIHPEDTTRIKLLDDVWSHYGTTDDGLTVQVTALGPINRDAS